MSQTKRPKLTHKAWQELQVNICVMYVQAFDLHSLAAYHMSNGAIEEAKRIRCEAFAITSQMQTAALFVPDPNNN